MSRATLLPTPGDPYISQLWITTFKKFWGKEAGQLYVHLNSGLPKEVFNFSKNLYESIGAKVICSNDGYKNHGHALTQMFKEVIEDNIFFIEDDFYIQTSGAVNNWFETIETKKVDSIVSYRGCCTESLRQQISSKFNLQDPVATQPNFWPCLCIVNKTNLLKTDLWFDSKSFSTGTYIKELDWIVPEDVCGDTFVWMSIQLRALGLTFSYIPQWRFIDALYHNLIPPPWVHSGATPLLYYHLLDEKGVPLGCINTTPRQHTKSPDQGIEEDWGRRIAMGELVYQNFKIPNSSKASFFNDKYIKALDKFASDSNISRTIIDKQRNILQNMLAPTLV